MLPDLVLEMALDRRFKEISKKRIKLYISISFSLKPLCMKIFINFI
jgi:hypothetical protein